MTTEPVLPCPCISKKDADDLRELCFALFDSMSALAGGRETPLVSEVKLARDLAISLSQRNLIHPMTPEKVVPGFVAAAEARDGEKAHFWARIMYTEAINLLQRASSCLEVKI